jgi:long-chain acyl-CoA synthetase
MGLNDFTFYDLICRNASVYGERPAWREIDTDETNSFAAIRSRVDRLASGLSAAGVSKGERLAAIGVNSIEFFLLYGAAAALGAIMLPINWRLSADELCYNVNDGAPRFLFADAAFQEMIEERLPDLSSLERCYNLKEDKGGFSSFSGLMKAKTGFPPVDVKEEDGFVIIHTAAVAGEPRGALVSHGNVLCAGLHLAYCFNLTGKDVHLNLLPLFHVAGLFMAFATFQAGGVNINISKFMPGQAVSLIEEHGVSVLFDFPPILAGILEAADEARADLKSLKAVVGLGTPEDIARFQKLTGGSYYTMYGQSETSMLATIGRYDDAPGSAGRPVALSDVRVVDEMDNPLATGQAGEIVMKGPLVFKGYWNRPEVNARTFRNGWHHTGDMGRFDDNGFLYFSGRMPEKELIKPGGENVYPAEVEKVILTHPAVRQTVVFGVPDPKWKEGIKAVCLLEAGAKLSPQELIDYVGSRIARYKKPQYVEMVSEIPLKDDGLPDRAKVKGLYGAG